MSHRIWSPVLHIPGNSHVDDVSGNGNDGTYTGGAYGDGPFSGRTVLNMEGGVNTFVSCGSGAGLSLSTGTVAAWLKSANASLSGYVIARRDGSGNNGYNIFITANSIAAIDGAGSTKDSTIDVVQNVWVHVAIVFADTALAFYVDGKLRSAQTITAFDLAATTDTRIGARDGATPTNYMSIADARIYDVALTGDEMMAVYRLSRR